MKDYSNINSYYDRPLIWKILNLWYIPAAIIFFVFSPFSLLYIGLVAKNKKWVRIFVLVISILVISTILLLVNINNPVGKFFSIPIALTAVFTIVYIIATAKEFLMRLDVILREDALFKNAKNSLDMDLVRRKNEPAALFIDSLHKWHREIESLKIKENIQQLIEVAGIVLKRHDEEGNKRFFTRYHDTLDEMLKKYNDFENSKLDTPEIEEAMKNIEAGLDTIVVALRNDAATLYKNDVLNTNAETAAFIQDLKNRGLLEDEKLKTKN